MKKCVLSLTSILSFASVFADQQSAQEPIIPYAHRINFEIPRFGYEHIKPDAIYVAAECWYLWGFDTHQFSLILGEAEGRIGYNFLLNPSNTLTPFAGVGYFKSFEHTKRQEIGFSSLGLRYEHVFGRTFNLGLNLEGMLGYSLHHRSSWGDPIWGVDVGVPFTWRFARKKNWDIRIEPFFTGWFGQEREGLFGGLRSAIGYRF
jgi:hypothetical protein